MNSTNQKFQPILLGSDFNVYGMARSFHEAYHIKSIALCAKPLAPTKFSHIVSVYQLDSLNTEAEFVSQITNFFHKYLHKDTSYLLIPCGDTYAKLLSKYQEELADLFQFSTIPFDMYEKLENKSSFYDMCEQYRIPYPKTMRIYRQNTLDYQTQLVDFPFSFPVVLKPSDSISYLPLTFPGKQKAYIINSHNELLATIRTIYQTTYLDSLLIQEYIPGSDANMRVLNAYVDHQHNVRMMFVGQPILEDPSPESIGNYVAILPDFQPAIFEHIQQLLTSIQYTGFANFDLKYDPRDQEFKLFEINLRQGRSSFFVTLNGFNLASYFVEDVVFKTPFTQTVLGTGNKLWLGAPARVILRYLSDEFLKNQVKISIAQHRYGTTSLYKQDFSFRHYALQYYAFSRYHQKFRKYFKKEFK